VYFVYFVVEHQTVSRNDVPSLQSVFKWWLTSGQGGQGHR
jgi:hypothetical protein